MANRRRGEVDLIVDGRPAVLCLTLGALAELEAAFAVDDLAALAERFASGRLAARDLERLLVCALRGGGRTVEADEVATMRFDGGLAAVATAIADLLALTFGTGEPSATTSPSPTEAASARPPAVPGAATPSPGTR